ncbi:hypothetical protein AMTRI_Chr04g180400 [Amborella trichopoda]
MFFYIYNPTCLLSSCILHIKRMALFACELLPQRSCDLGFGFTHTLQDFKRVPCCCPLQFPETTLANGRVFCSTIIKKRVRYRKQYPGESKGIVEEMRFVAMRLRTEETEDGPEGTWEPTIEGYLKYLVDNKLVFGTLDRIVDEAPHVAYADFRNTGLERSIGLSKDLEWFRLQGYVIPEPSNPGTAYAKYLEEIAEKSAPAFLCHFYNIYFAHVAGSRVIGKQVSEKILDGKDLEFYKWLGDAAELLGNVREKLNNHAEYWSRYEKNKCLREAAKSFRYSSQILRLIVV